MHAQHPTQSPIDEHGGARQKADSCVYFNLAFIVQVHNIYKNRFPHTHTHTKHTPLSLPLSTPLSAHTRPLNTAHRAAVAAIVCANAQRKRDTSIL